MPKIGTEHSLVKVLSKGLDPNVACRNQATRRTSSVYEKRKYRVQSVSEAKRIALDYMKTISLDKAIEFGLPEVDDRYHVWRVPLKDKNDNLIGEVVIDARTSLLEEEKTTGKEILESRILGRIYEEKTGRRLAKEVPKLSNMRNTVGLGDSEDLLAETPSESIDLIFTSPPYYNAKPEYSDYIQYEEYLLKMKKVINQSHRVLSEGRFFVINVSPVLIRRVNRSSSSRRIALPFDFHRILTEEGFDFVDDIIWVKPEGAGWATGRGRRFAADRNPLQYKPVPVTEYVLVYRKSTDKLIDWHIRKHPCKGAVKNSRIKDGYEVTNIWKIHPGYSKDHPAIFPLELAEKVISYYSFENDVVLDPFAGIGTVGEAACKLRRRFVLFEINEQYVGTIRKNIPRWLKGKIRDINWINCDPSNGYNGHFEF